MNAPFGHVGTTDGNLLQEVLAQFGISKLTAHQTSLIGASLEGQDILGVLPTGAGKSACFQIPGVMLGVRTLVISPLIALQDDQVQALRKVGVKAFAFHSNQTEGQRLSTLFYFATPRDEPAFLYISPELLLSEIFNEHFRGVRFDRLVIDEVHCVSTWGDSFRPDYQRIALAARKMGIPHCAAFTAIIDPKIEEDIQRRLPLRPGYFKLVADPVRPNLTLRMDQPARREQAPTAIGRLKFGHLLSLLSDPEYAGPVLIYTNTREAAISLSARMHKQRPFLKRTGYTPYLYHANVTYREKELALAGFLADERPLVIATTAFGMGVNRSNVRQVIHYQTPYNLLEYANQIGRAGRDGLPSLCTTFTYAIEHHDRRKHLLAEIPTYAFVERVRDRLAGTVARLHGDERTHYNLRQFLIRTGHIVENNAHIPHKDMYMRRVHTAIALLQRQGIIAENESGLTIKRLPAPASKGHLALLEETRMHERMVVRQQEKSGKFFSNLDADQALLWKIIGEE